MAALAGTAEVVPPLRDEELVSRIIYDPECIADDGSVAPAAIPTDHLKTSGYSLNRDFVPLPVVLRLVEGQLKGKPAGTQAAVCRLVAGQVRQLNGSVREGPDGTPIVEHLMTIEASPQPENLTLVPPFPANPAHAHILAVNKSRSALKKLRTDYLLPLFQKPISLGRFVEMLEGQHRAHLDDQEFVAEGGS
jgi:hypothetical protein